MAIKRYSCRTHGGVFEKESTAGRPPVRCGGDKNPLCDKANLEAGIPEIIPAKDKPVLERAREGIRKRAEASAVVSIADQAGAQGRFEAMTNAELKAYAREHFSTISKITSRAQLIRAMQAQIAKAGQATPEQVAEAVARVEGVPAEQVTAVKARQSKPAASAELSATLSMAKAAKEQLVVVGWTVEGRGGVAPEGPFARVTASRDAETLVIEWVNGKLIAQDYSMNYIKPSENMLPGRKLNFDPDELTDRELIQKISGMKVTWWNTLGSSTETAVVPGDRVTVQHIFVGNGDEDNSKRIVTFVDRNAGGFRSFHTSMLMKVG